MWEVRSPFGAGALAGLGLPQGVGESLGDHHAEGEAGVDDLGADPRGCGDAALAEGVEACLASERHALVDRLEGAAVEEVGQVHGGAGVRVWEKMARVVVEFDRLPRGGSTVFGFAIGVYPTDHPGLPGSDDGA